MASASRRVDTVTLEMDILEAEALLEVLSKAYDNAYGGLSNIYRALDESDEIRNPSPLFRASGLIDLDFTN